MPRNAHGRRALSILSKVNPALLKGKVLKRADIEKSAGASDDYGTRDANRRPYQEGRAPPPGHAHVSLKAGTALFSSASSTR